MDDKEPHAPSSGAGSPTHQSRDGSNWVADPPAQTLQDALNYAEMIVDTVREGLLILTPDLHVRSASLSFYEKFQVTPEETVGRLVYEIDDGQWDIPALRRLLEEVLPDNVFFNDFEVEHTFDRIGHLVMALNARRLDHHQLILLAIEDVTERRREERSLRASEERLRLLIENMKEYGIFALDTDGRVTMWSPGAERILGWSVEEAIGMKCDEIFTPEDVAAGVPEQERATARANGSALDERWHVRKDGSRFWATGVMVALRAGDDLKGYAKILRDATEQKRAQVEREALLDALAEERQKLQDLNATLEERVVERTNQVRALASTLTRAEQEERRRISQVLHDDLQQQLYGVQMKMHRARRDAEADHCEGVLTNVGAAEEWLRSAIDVTRRLTVDLSPPVLKDEGLTAALGWLRTQMQQTHGLTVDIEAEHPFRMPDADMRVLLFQVVRELLFNVVKHADTDRATVTLQAADHHVRIVVADEGRGFDVETAFARAGRDDGFGLFSVRERLDLFDGEMDIESAPGQGTRVTLTVPVQLDL
ncbi:MAG TPA: PAS domain S-box protein [Rubricoccaceae bacterium]|nr:PAS domain S-box protein [Rubricoccaceae bacterium]